MPGIVTFYADLWAAQVTQYADYGAIYGWLAVASLIVCLAGILFAVFRRADGIQAAGLIGQHFLIYAIPFLAGGLLGVAG